VAAAAALGLRLLLLLAVPERRAGAPLRCCRSCGTAQGACRAPSDECHIGLLLRANRRGVRAVVPSHCALSESVAAQQSCTTRSQTQSRRKLGVIRGSAAYSSPLVLHVDAMREECGAPDNLEHCSAAQYSAVSHASPFQRRQCLLCSLSTLSSLATSSVPLLTSIERPTGPFHRPSSATHFPAGCGVPNL
jgi:hypothetical protein